MGNIFTNNQMQGKIVTIYISHIYYILRTAFSSHYQKRPLRIATFYTNTFPERNTLHVENDIIKNLVWPHAQISLTLHYNRKKKYYQQYIHI